MRILFTADYHIKLGQKNVPYDWAVNRYSMFFALLSSIESECDLHIIGGDLFDRMPTIAELNIYFSFISNVTIPTLIFDGNHEATKKNKTFFTELAEISARINPLVKVYDTVVEENDFTILPYCDIHKKGIFDTLNKNKPLFTHVRGEIPPHVKPEIDLALLEDFPIVFAGDLHSHSNTQLNIVYPGSPMTTSFHRSIVDTGYIIIEDDFSWKWYKFPELPQLIRKTVTNPNDMIATDFHHTIYELEGDMQDLASVENSELLDKKLVKRNTEATLVITKEMTIQDELVEYLSYILSISEDKIPDIIGIFNDYTKRA